jgi:hypothetical protein
MMKGRAAPRTTLETTMTKQESEMAVALRVPP